MMGEVKLLSVIGKEMTKLGINYSYLYYDSEEIIYPYVTGEYIENGYTFENGAYMGYLFLECWHKGSNTELLLLCEKIKEHFRCFNHYEEGFTCNVSYSNKEEQQQDDIDLKKIEIQLDVKYWRGEK